MFNGPINHSTCPTCIQILPKKKKKKVFKEADALFLEPICLALCVYMNPPFQDPPYKNVLLSQVCTLVIFSGTAFLLCQVKLG